MSKDRRITGGKLPSRVCPICGEQVWKVIKHRQLSYECKLHWGPWDKAIKRPAPADGKEGM